MIHKHYKNLYVDSEFSKLNYENFLKQYWISVKFSRLLNPEKKKQDAFLSIRYFSASDFPTFRHYLREEKKQLDKYIEFVDSNSKSDNNSDISEEINNLEKELRLQQKKNSQNLEK